MHRKTYLASQYVLVVHLTDAEIEEGGNGLLDARTIHVSHSLHSWMATQLLESVRVAFEVVGKIPHQVTTNNIRHILHSPLYCLAANLISWFAVPRSDPLFGLSRLRSGIFAITIVVAITAAIVV